MESIHAKTAADPERLTAALPAAPDDWHRDDTADVVEYRLPDAESPCHAATLTVRPDPLSEAAVRIDRTVNCSGAGTTRHDDVESAASAVRRALEAT